MLGRCWFLGGGVGARHIPPAPGEPGRSVLDTQETRGRRMRRARLVRVKRVPRAQSRWCRGFPLGAWGLGGRGAGPWIPSPPRPGLLFPADCSICLRSGSPGASSDEIMTAAPPQSSHSLLSRRRPSRHHQKNMRARKSHLQGGLSTGHAFEFPVVWARRGWR